MGLNQEALPVCLEEQEEGGGLEPHAVTRPPDFKSGCPPVSGAFQNTHTRTRTGTTLRPLAPQASETTNSSTWAKAGREGLEPSRRFHVYALAGRWLTNSPHLPRLNFRCKTATQLTLNRGWPVKATGPYCMPLFTSNGKIRTPNQIRPGTPFGTYF